jgi:uncharacterized membrane protein YdbT with pleckstrin-like domain
MAFPESYLHDSESLVLNLKPHWWTFAQPVTFALGALVAAVLLQSVDSGLLTWLGVAIVVVALINLAVVYGKWATTFFVLSSERLIFRTGVLTKRGIEIPLNRINNVNFRQSLFERLIGAGDLLVESAGESGQSRFSDIRKPDAVQNEIYRQVENQRRSGGQAPEADPVDSAPVGGSSTSQLLEELNEMRRGGLISAEEFEAKRRDVLDRM